MIFDTHVHYDDKVFDTDRDELLSGLYSHGIEAVTDIGTDISSSKKAIELSKRYDFVYAAIGVHPSEVTDMSEDDIEWLRRCVKPFSDTKNTKNDSKIVAIGEIGLDYHWSKKDDERDNQKHWFRRQIALAKEVGLPIVIHSRDAADDTMQIIKEEKAYECTGVIHCYSYDALQAREYINMGFYIGVGGIVTFKNGKELKKTVKQTDLSHIVLETDCPYLAPEPHRGERNDSTLLPYVVKEISSIKGVSEDEVIEVTKKNAMRMYRL